MSDFALKGSVILITGGTGSWGNELTTQLLDQYSPKEIRIYSRGEHKQVEMKRKYQNQKLKFIIGDIRDKDRLTIATKGVDVIFHLAALKHVPVCEENPWEAVQTNIVGTQNLIEAAIENKIKKVVDVSTDKAVDPFNLYGVTKSCGEKLFIAANVASDSSRFVCIRGGNVIGTNGSVVPLFKEQLHKLNEITITDREMTRFFMSVGEAIQLVLKATIDSVGGEVFVMKMPACKIVDLGDVMIDEFGNAKAKVKVIGIRPGEKLYEVLVSRYESPRTYDLGEYFVILPQIKMQKTEDFYKNQNFSRITYEEFNSNNASILDKSNIRTLLRQNGWFEDGVKQEALSYLEALSPSDLENFFKTEGWIKE